PSVAPVRAYPNRCVLAEGQFSCMQRLTPLRTKPRLACHAVVSKMFRHCGAAAQSPRRSSTEISVESRTTSRRTFLTMSCGLPLRAAPAGCGTSGPTAPGGCGHIGGGGAKATYSFLSTEPQEGVRRRAAERFNKANPAGQLEFSTFQNDAFKTKI